jgi:oligosaccharyltransferase complex subunit delta (ribophorin II)
MKCFKAAPLVLAILAAVTECVVPATAAAKVAVSNLVVSVTDGPLSTTASQLTATYPDQVSNGKVIAANSSQYIHVVYTIASESSDPLTVEQSVVCFRHKESKHEAYFPSKATKNGKHTVSISTANEKGFNYNSGDYELLLYVADAAVSNPISWNFAVMNVQVPEDVGPPQLPIYTVSLTHETDTATAPLKVINHVFRTPDSRAPVVMSIAFSIVLAAAFVALVIAFPMVGGSLKALSSSLPQIAFLLTLLGILVLYVMLWVSLDLLTTLTVLSPAGVLLVVVGRAALAAHEEKSKRSAAKASKSE